MTLRMYGLMKISTSLNQFQTLLDGLCQKPSLSF
jgi:hypothetical protein